MFIISFSYILFIINFHTGDLGGAHSSTPYHVEMRRIFEYFKTQTIPTNKKHRCYLTKCSFIVGQQVYAGAPAVFATGSDLRGTIYAIYSFSEQVIHPRGGKGEDKRKGGKRNEKRE